MENKESILAKLYGNEPELQKEAIEDIKREGDFTVIPDLLDFVVREKDNLAIINLLTDIKDERFKSFLIHSIKNNPEPAARQTLLRICWESSLDFSEFAVLFTHILLEDDFPVALEASTILENLTNLNGQERKEVIALLKNSQQKTEYTQLLVKNVLEHFLA